MHLFDIFLLIGMAIGGLMSLSVLYDLYRAFSLHTALVRSLAADQEFLLRAPQVWQREWQDQCDDADFKKLCAIIVEHIVRLSMQQSREMPWPMNQTHLMRRVRFVRALVSAVQKNTQSR